LKEANYTPSMKKHFCLPELKIPNYLKTHIINKKQIRRDELYQVIINKFDYILA